MKAFLLTSGTTRGRGATLGTGWGRSPLPFFESQKKCPDFGKRGPYSIHLWVKFSI